MSPFSNTSSGSPKFYTISYTNTTSFTCSFSVIEPNQDCDDGLCSDLFTLSISSICSLAADIDVTVFATNDLGNGSSSDQVAIGISNTINCIIYHPILLQRE